MEDVLLIPWKEVAWTGRLQYHVAAKNPQLLRVAKPLSPMVHSYPSLANGRGDGLDKAVIVGFWDRAIFVECRTFVRRGEKKGLFFLMSYCLMKRK